MGFVPAAEGQISLLGLSVPEALKRNLVAYVPQSEEVDWAFPVLVEDVVPGSLASDLGIVRLDVIVKVNGIPVGHAEDIRRIVQDVPDGGQVEVEVIRRGEALKLLGQK